MSDVEWFQIFAHGDVEELWDVFGGVAVGEDFAGRRTGVESVVFAAGSEAVDADNFLLVGVHYGDDREGVAVVVGVGVFVAHVFGKAEALGVSVECQR